MRRSHEIERMPTLPTDPSLLISPAIKRKFNSPPGPERKKKFKETQLLCRKAMALRLCNECSSDFERDFQLDEHVKRKHATSPVDSDPVKELEQHICALCSFRSGSKLSLHEHVKVVHKPPSAPSVHIQKDKSPQIDESSVKCDHCKYSADSSLLLVRHHSTCTRKRSPCALCPTPSTLPVEEVNIMDLCIQTLEMEVHVCTKCPYQTTVKEDFEMHQFIHKGLAQLQAECSLPAEDGNGRYGGDATWFDCEQCPQRFTRKEHMRRHVATQHAAFEDITWYPCEVCPSRFKRKEHLKRHMLSHAAPEDIVWFSCEVCSQRFKRKEHLKRHMLRGAHSVDKFSPQAGEVSKDQPKVDWYSCNQCQARFRTGNGLRRHYKEHGSQDVFVC